MTTTNNNIRRAASDFGNIPATDLKMEAKVTEDVKGKWIWLGSSNEKNFRKDFETETRKFELCTKLTHFTSMVETVHEGYEFLTITGIDNIIADLADGGKLKEKIESFFNLLEEQRRRGMKITVGPLLPWKKHSKETKRDAVIILKEMKVLFPGIKQIARPQSLNFNRDNVHLTDRAALNHFKCVFSASCETFFNNEDYYLTEDENMEQMDQTDVQIISQANPQQTGQELEFSAHKRPRDSSGPATKAKVRKLDEVDHEDEDEGDKHSIHNKNYKVILRKINDLNKKMEARWTVDLIASAGTKEDLDRIENNLNMNKVVVMGLDVPEIWEKEDWRQRIAVIKDAVAELFNFINPGVDYALGYVKHLNPKLKAARQIVEVTLESEKKGKGIRKAYAEKIKEWRANKLFPDRMAGVSITPALTLATRVRIAMLKTMAKLIEDEFEATSTWVIQHVARPVLKVEQEEKDGKKILTSYGFAQALAFCLKEMPEVRFSDQQLFTAYTIAGTKFGPEISHYFVLLEMQKAMEIEKRKNQKQTKKK